MSTRVSLEQKLSVRCPKCSANPGDKCTYYSATQNSIRVGVTTPHRERRDKYLRKHGAERAD